MQHFCPYQSRRAYCLTRITCPLILHYLRLFTLPFMRLSSSLSTNMMDLLENEGIWEVCGLYEDCTQKTRETFTQRRWNVGPASATLDQHWTSLGWTSRVCWVFAGTLPASEWVRAGTLDACGNIDISALAISHFSTETLVFVVHLSESYCT